MQVLLKRLALARKDVFRDLNPLEKQWHGSLRMLFEA